MPFLTNADYDAVSKQEVRDIVTASNAAVRRRAEATAISIVTGYLNFLYDTDAIFALNAYDYDNTVIYEEGDIVIDTEGNAYKCIAEATPPADLSDLSLFAPGDPRNPFVVMATVDIAVYTFHSRLSTNRITATVETRHTEALDMLKQIRAQKFNPELPFRNQTTNPVAETSISVTSNDKFGNKW